MNIKGRLTIMSFLQFFIWGAWLITVGNYWFATKQWSGSEFGAIFSTLGISSIIMPALTGIIADKHRAAPQDRRGGQQIDPADEVDPSISRDCGECSLNQLTRAAASRRTPVCTPRSADHEGLRERSPFAVHAVCRHQPRRPPGPGSGRDRPRPRP